ncbi:FG-GAP repeat protein [Marinimicrobium sp. ABcell2]|uniref:FG-GAP repeat protein n=1 Tax=Marinimicrobium sp. ABcell2 TaxID=3069751 RepID=UPI0027B63451|nr:FG-GAP repeat protein [Marinimicrobium sp. ABcell2]MDQ2077958.1 hypothetical protein [Marinimicrobium sp. ABcell2]
MITHNNKGWPIKHACLTSLFSAILLLSACGGGQSDAETPPPEDSSSPPPSESWQPIETNAEWPDVNVYSLEPKVLQFSWTPVDGATHYRLLKDPDGSSGFTQVGDDLTEPSAQDAISVHRHDWANARYIVEACDADDDCQESSTTYTSDVMLHSIGYFKASNASRDDWFGWSLALSGDGQTMAVGAPREASNAQGINGDQDDDSVFGAGAVYVFTLEDGQWAQEAYVKASNTDRRNDRFGFSVSLSDDGNVMAVGAIREDSNASGINGNQDNNRGTDSGAVYTFARADGDWTQTAYIKPSNTAAAPGEDDDEEENGSETEAEDTTVPANVGFRFGHSVKLSGDGLTLAVGAIGETSAARGIGGNQSNREAPASGAVYVFTQGGENNWSQQAYVKASNTDRLDLFGWSLALSENGNTLAVGAIDEASLATGIGGDQANNRAPGTGAVYVFTRSDGTWSQQAYVKPGHTYSGFPTSVRKHFGRSISLSADGRTLAVGAPGDLSLATGANADPEDYDRRRIETLALNSGAAYIFRRSNSRWSQTAYLKASNSSTGIQFGRSLALSGDGQELLVGAWRENGNATGINGDETDQERNNSGSAYLFSLNDGSWQQDAYIKAPNTGLADNFGISVGISTTGDTLAIGAHREKSNATGINGNRNNRSANYSGAVYLY